MPTFNAPLPPTRSTGDAPPDGPAGDVNMLSTAVTEVRGQVPDAPDLSEYVTTSDANATYVPVFTYSSPLRKWFAGLANRAAEPVQIGVFGDSIAEGTGTDAHVRRWQNMLQASLRARFGVQGGAEYPFIPGYETASSDHPGVARTGTVTHFNNWGLGGRTALIGADGAVTFTFTGTSAEIMYDKASGTGVMRVVVDGGAPVIVNTNSSSNPPGGAPVLWGTGPLTDGPHTVVVTRDATSAADQNVYVEGLLTYRGDEDAGIRVIDSSRHGTSSTYLDATRTVSMAKSLDAAGGAHLAVIAYGTNDYGITTQAEFRTNVERQITALRANGFDGSVLLVQMYMAADRDVATWTAYGDTMAAMAASDPDIAYFDLRRVMPDVPTPFTAPEGLGLFADTIHPNDAGSGWIADALTAHLSIRA